VENLSADHKESGVPFVRDSSEYLAAKHHDRDEDSHAQDLLNEHREPDLPKGLLHHRTDLKVCIIAVEDKHDNCYLEDLNGGSKDTNELLLLLVLLNDCINATNHRNN